MVRTQRIPYTYAIVNKLENLDRIADLIQREGTDLMAFYGVGNHGGGPTIELLHKLHERDMSGQVFSAPDEYFAHVEYAQVPIVSEFSMRKR